MVIDFIRYFSSAGIALVVFSFRRLRSKRFLIVSASVIAG